MDDMLPQVNSVFEYGASTIVISLDGGTVFCLDIDGFLQH